MRCVFHVMGVYQLAFFCILCTKSGKKSGLYKKALDECLDLSVHPIVKVLASDCVAKP